MGKRVFRLPNRTTPFLQEWFSMFEVVVGSATIVGSVAATVYLLLYLRDRKWVQQHDTGPDKGSGASGINPAG
jgi:hypothetical protein